VADPRGVISRLFYRFNDEYRTHVNRHWQQEHGTPPPWTAAGRKHLRDQQQFNELLANPPQIHGDARWMTREQAEAIATRISPQDGSADNATFYLGNAVDMENNEIHCPAVSHPPGHVLTIAATRAGKGAAQIVPNLVVYGGSMLIIDPKGENYALTHRMRRKRSQVFRIDPFKVTQPIDNASAFSCFNPLATLDDSSDAARLAEILLGDPPTGDGRFFHDEALQLLKALLLWVSRSPVTTMSAVREVLTLQDEPIGQGSFGSPLEEALQLMIGDTKDPAIIRPIRTFLGKHDRLRSSILATINAPMAIWDERGIAETVDDHHFDLEALKTGKMTVYVILPFDKLRSYSAFLRMFVGLFYRAMIRDGTPARTPVACVIDEFPALGQMTEIVNALAEIAGYGVRFWLFAQGLVQLKAIYPHHYNLILSQCATKCVFGVTDGETAQWLSDEVGKTTVALRTPSLGNSGGGMDGKGYPTGGANSGQSIQLTGKPLLSVADIREVFGVGGDMSDRKRFQIVFLSGYPPMVATLEPWFVDKDLKTLLEELPAQIPTQRNAASQEWTGIPENYSYSNSVKGSGDA